MLLHHQCMLLRIVALPHVSCIAWSVAAAVLRYSTFRSVKLACWQPQSRRHDLLATCIKVQWPSNVCSGFAHGLPIFYCYILQILAELSTPENVSNIPGQDIISTVAGVESDSTLGLTYYFTQSELQELLESERQTQLKLLGQDVAQLPMSD